MVYHRQTKLKINGKQLIPISKYEFKRRKIKHLQRYINKFQESDNENLLKLINQFYSYLLRKSIITDTEFIKNEILLQIDAIIDAYRNDYDPSEFHKIKNKLALVNKEHYGYFFTNKRDKAERIRNLSEFTKSNFYAAKHYIFSDYK